jgi:hypothetical protein
MRVSFPARRIRLTGNARRAFIGDQATNNHQVASAGQGAFVAMWQNEKGMAASPKVDRRNLKFAQRAG